MASKIFFSAFIPSCSVIYFNFSVISPTPIFLKSNLWQREIMVSGILCTSVVHRIKTTLAGGSSRVFKSALKAETESMCTSSIIKTLYFLREGEIRELAIIFSRTLSTPVWLAASISIISRLRPAVISRQDSHLLQGSDSPFFLFKQFIDLAKTRAKVVFPTALGPQKR